MTSRKVDDYALTLYELAQHGSPVDVALWERVVGISCEGPRGEGRRASPENQRQTFKRFRDWAAQHGLAIEKRIVEGEPIVIEFDASAARALAVKLRPRLSRRPVTKSNQEARVATTGYQRAEPISIKQAAVMLGLSERALARWLRERPPFPFLRVGRIIRIRREDVLAWIEAHTVRPTMGRRK